MKTRTIATTVLAGAVLAGTLALPTTTVEAGTYYSPGVKSLHAEPVDCSAGYGASSVCAFGATEANTVVVTQSDTGNGQYEFDTLADGTWLALEIGATCRTSHRLFAANVSNGMAPTDAFWTDVEQLGSWAHPVSVPNEKSMAPTEVAVPTPNPELFAGSVPALAAFPNPSDIYAAGEAEIARRIADGMTETEARALPWELHTAARVLVEVVCRYVAWPHSKWQQTAEVLVPFTIRYEPVEIPVGAQHGVADDLHMANVTHVDLHVEPDLHDPCVLHLFGTIVTNGPTNVEYRYVSPFGTPSDTESVAIDDGGIGFVHRSVQIPFAPTDEEDDGFVDSGLGVGQAGDWAPIDTGGVGPVNGDKAVVDDGKFSGTFEFETTWPNQVSAVDGFSVDYCDQGTVGELGGTFGGLRSANDPTHRP
jgi:hypothetical protein